MNKSEYRFQEQIIIENVDKILVCFIIMFFKGIIKYISMGSVVNKGTQSRFLPANWRQNSGLLVKKSIIKQIVYADEYTIYNNGLQVGNLGPPVKNNIQTPETFGHLNIWF